MTTKVVMGKWFAQIWDLIQRVVILPFPSEHKQPQIEFDHDFQISFS